MNDAALKASKANGSKVTIVVRLIIENLSTTVSTVMKPNQIYHSNSNKEAKPGTFFSKKWWPQQQPTHGASWEFNQLLKDITCKQNSQKAIFLSLKIVA